MALDQKRRQFLEENPFVGTVTTLRDDGSPHSTVVWVDVEDGKGLLQHAKKYLGKDEYPFRNPTETRVKVLIEPERVDSAGFEN